MKLLYSLTSPYARKVRIVAAEKRIAVDLVEVVLADPDCPVQQYNPLGKIPVLVLDDGDSLYDSSVIVDYLDQRTPVSHLVPQDTKSKFQVKRWESLADGVCDAGVAVDKRVAVVAKLRGIQVAKNHTVIGQHRHIRGIVGSGTGGIAHSTAVGDELLLARGLVPPQQIVGIGACIGK